MVILKKKIEEKQDTQRNPLFQEDNNLKISESSLRSMSGHPKLADLQKDTLGFKLVRFKTGYKKGFSNVADK